MQIGRKSETNACCLEADATQMEGVRCKPAVSDPFT